MHPAEPLKAHNLGHLDSGTCGVEAPDNFLEAPQAPCVQALPFVDDSGPGNS